MVEAGRTRHRPGMQCFCTYSIGIGIGQYLKNLCNVVWRQIFKVTLTVDARVSNP